MRYCETSLWDKPFGEVRYTWKNSDPEIIPSAYALTRQTFNDQYSDMDGLAMRYCEASLWDKPFGEVRYAWKNSDPEVIPSAYALTRQTFTDQYSYADDPSTAGVEGFGLMFYQSRFYDPSLSRFISADSIVPGGVQGYDRYAYTNNNPIRYTDPTGHVPCMGDNFDDGPQCKTKNSAAYNPKTLEDFRNMTWRNRKAWLQSFAQRNQLGDWFDDMAGAIDFMMHNPSLSRKGGIAEVMDAAVLKAINDGWNGDTSGGGAGWAEFFKEYTGGGFDENHLIVTRLKAEQQGVDYAFESADTQSAYENSSHFDQGFFDLFKTGADDYRSAAIKFRSDPMAVEGAKLSLFLGPSVITTTDPRTSGPTLVGIGQTAWLGYVAYASSNPMFGTH